jgi:uncharacterized protein (DUF433 family)
MSFPSLSNEILERLGTLAQNAAIEDDIKQQVQELYPELSSEDVEAFLHYLSVKQTRTEVYQRLADS